MLRLLIADDEFLSRHAFSTILQKNFPDIQISAEAENGMEALEKARELHPDIIVMDIRMPGINGLAAAEQILLEMPSTVIIIISAFDDFDYLQKALEIGVKAYFLKPFHAGSIVTKLKRIIECINNERKKREHPDIEQNLKGVEKIIQKELVRSYINGGALTKNTAFYRDFFHYDVKQGYFLVVILHNLADNLREDAIHYTLFREKIVLSISESLEYLCFHMMGNVMLNYIPIFIPVQPDYNFQTESILIGKEILRKLNYHRLSGSVAIGTVKSGSEYFHLSYEEAMSQIHVLQPNEIQIVPAFSKPVASYVYPYEKESKLTDALRKKEISQAKELSREILRSIITASINLTLKKEYLAQHFAAMKHMIYTLGFDTETFNSQWPFSSLAYMENEEELLTFCQCYLEDFMKILSQQFQSPNYVLTKKVEQYLEIHLTDSSCMSLENIAAYLGLSPQYVSKIFKEEYSQTFTEYINWRRVELAKGYLRNTASTVTQIAEMTGYTDSNYFCRIFKKITGMTPKEFRLNR